MLPFSYIEGAHGLHITHLIFIAADSICNHKIGEWGITKTFNWMGFAWKSLLFRFGYWKDDATWRHCRAEFLETFKRYGEIRALKYVAVESRNSPTERATDVSLLLLDTRYPDFQKYSGTSYYPTFQHWSYEYNWVNRRFLWTRGCCVLLLYFSASIKEKPTTGVDNLVILVVRQWCSQRHSCISVGLPIAHLQLNAPALSSFAITLS